MSEYIHQDDAYEWLRDKEIVFAEQDFAKVQVERDQWKRTAEVLARELGKVEYAQAEYENQEGVPNEANNSNP
jgi:hypothetical protein